MDALRVRDNKRHDDETLIMRGQIRTLPPSSMATCLLVFLGAFVLDEAFEALAFFEDALEADFFLPPFVEAPFFDPVPFDFVF